ncbi:MAG: N-acetyltransferase [Phycisphaerae bacterium]|nr:N-acetyltransferase [Phycisphaerae bacterium]
MEIRPARMGDIPAMAELINHHAERGRMLHRSPAYLYERVRNFCICRMDGCVAGCCALEPVWTDLGELKSLAVREDLQGQGIGTSLIERSLEAGRSIDIKRVFCLTREPRFFENLGFSGLERNKLPHKVWSDCVNCPVKDNCDEVALLLDL